MNDTNIGIASHYIHNKHTFEGYHITTFILYLKYTLV